MDKIAGLFHRAVQNRRAQILLPAVMLAPIFILVVYLLFETAKLSMTKVRQQFALDNSAYSQMSVASTYLNAVAMVNGPLPFRVMQQMNTSMRIPEKTLDEGGEPRTVFDVFYAAGAIPSIGPKYTLGPAGAVSNSRPTPESVDWGVRYYGEKRKNWMKEDPTDATDGEKDPKDDSKDVYVITDKTLSAQYFFEYGEGDNLAWVAIRDYFKVFVRTGSIYGSQTYVYKDNMRNNRMFRQSYSLNTLDCKESECGKQAAATLSNFVLETKPVQIDDTAFYFSDVSLDPNNEDNTIHNLRARGFGFSMTDMVETKLFQFAYLTPLSRSRLRKMARGILLKQSYKLPANRFNINLAQRYKPYVRNTIYLSCPRGNNNCVWPNPLPKYSVRVGV